MGISLKVNVSEWLEVKLTFFEVIVQHFNHYTMAIPLVVVAITKNLSKIGNQLKSIF